MPYLHNHAELTEHTDRKETKSSINKNDLLSHTKNFTLNENVINKDPFIRDFVTLNKAVVNYLPRCSYHLLYNLKMCLQAHNMRT